MPRTPTSEIEARLINWANWETRCNGYPSGRRSSIAAGPPQSRPPRGVNMPEDVHHVSVAIQALAQQGRADMVVLLKAWHLRGLYFTPENRTVVKVAEYMGLPKTTFHRQLREAERKLQQVYADRVGDTVAA